MKKLILTAIFLLISLSVSSFVYAASTVNSQIQVDWSKLNITGGTISAIPFEYKGLHSEGWINGPDPSNLGYLASNISNGYGLSDPDWATASSTHTIGLNTNIMETENDFLTNTTISQSIGDGDTSGWINGNLHRRIDFTADNDATYTFSIGYNIDVDLSRNNSDEESASNSSLIKLFIREGSSDLDLAFASDPYSSNFSANELTFELNDEKNLSFTADLESGTRYWLELHIHTSSETSSTYNPVPIPSTIVLFGIGLLGLAGVSKKKK